MTTKVDGKYFDEMEGKTAPFKSAGEHVKLSTKGQIKMLAMAAKTKYATHTNVEVPGTVVKEEAEEISELNRDTVYSYKHKAEKAIDHHGNEIGKIVKAKKITHDDVKTANKHGDKLHKRIAGIDRAEKRLGEEVEEISELSKKTLGSYVKKASADASKHSSDSGRSSSNHGLSNELKSLAKKRLTGVSKATDRIVKEESEQIDELSRKTLGSYVGKAASNAVHSAHGVGMMDKDHPMKPDKTKKVLSRLKSIQGASARLAKEEVEQIDELSNEKLGAYKKAAGADASAADKSGDFKRGNKRFSGIIKATKKQFANDAKSVKESFQMMTFMDFIRLDHTEYEVIDEEVIEVGEEFIGLSDFEHKLDTHRKTGHVLHHSYDHKAKKAVIRHADKEGEVRQFHYSEKGTKVERLAPIENKHVTNDEGKSVTKHDAPGHEKRGRGRPPGKYHGTYKPREKKAA